MGFSLPQLNTCCCGCTLRTGTLIILWLYLVFGILAVTLPSVVPDVNNNSNKTNSTTANVSTPTLPAQNTRPVTVVDYILGIISVVVSGIGLYGVYKEIHLYLVPFLTWEMVYVVVQIAIILFGAFSVPALIGGLIGFLIFFYFWLVVFSHYRVLKGSVRPIQA